MIGPELVSAGRWAALIRAQVAYHGVVVAQIYLDPTNRLRSYILGAMWAEIGKYLGVLAAR